MDGMKRVVVILAAAAAVAHSAPAAAQGRPDGLSVGLGAGWDLPADVTQPNTVSARFRLPSGLTIEPRVRVAVTDQVTETGSTEFGTTTTDLDLAAVLRWPLIMSGPVDFLVLGGAEMGYAKVNPDGQNNSTISTTVGLIWGLSVEYWWRSRVSIGFTATNPLIARSTTEMQTSDTTNKSLGIGAVFDPDILLMIHLFY